MAETCPVVSQEWSRDVEEILRRYHTIAVVGLSPNPERDSYRVAKYLKEQGYRVIPVNPAVAEVLGEKSYPELRFIPEKVDVVDVFRRSDAVPPIADEAIAMGAKALWLQEGVVHEEAAQKACDARLKVVMDRCMMREHRRLFGIPE